MNHGTVIEELFEIVERVEVHTQPLELHNVEMHNLELHNLELHNLEMRTMATTMAPEAMYPAFLAELLQANFGTVGAA